MTTPSPASVPTADDVARRAGVSRATVSYVINGRRGGASRVSDATRVRVLTAMDQLGYVPNHAARSLRRSRTDRICLLLSRLGSPYGDVLAADVQRLSGERGYSTVIAVTNSPESETHVVAQLRRRLADGIIDFAGLPQETLALLARAGIAVVALGNPLVPNGFDVVHTTESDACYEAVDHLLDLGHRRIAFLGHTADHTGDRERYGSYARAQNGRDIRVEDRFVRTGAVDRADAYRSVTTLLATDDRPSALFAASDIGAISAIWAARDAGLRVPADLAVVGVGNIPEGQISRPALSSVGPIRHDFGEVAELLLDRLTHDPGAAGRVLLRPWSFFPRGSTAPAPVDLCN